jgi:hypothetical protein
MSGHAWAEVVGAAGLFALITTVLSVTIVQVFTTWRARAALAREDEYRKLAETAVRTQENTERLLVELGNRVAGMESRMASVEQVLKEVE